MSDSPVGAATGSSDGAARYPIPAASHRREEVIERSRFIATLAHAPTTEAARDFIDQVKAEFPDATHNCWAYVAGPPGETAAIGMSDDGEPHGTAGRPMLTALLHGGVGEVAAVVTRYYGGVKLGKGGLGRAYSGAVQGALEGLAREERIVRERVTVVVAYPSIDGLRQLVDAFEIETNAEEYGEEVTYRLAVPSRRLMDFEEAVATLTSGSGRVERERAEREPLAREAVEREPVAREPEERKRQDGATG